ncbi:MAG: hypothetical protein ACYCTG_12600, partial [Ferrimicrobium sp.]
MACYNEEDYAGYKAVEDFAGGTSLMAGQPRKASVNGHLNLHRGGHLSCTVTDTSFARVKASARRRVAPSFRSGLVLERHHPLTREGLGESDGLTGRL